MNETPDQLARRATVDNPWARRAWTMRDIVDLIALDRTGLDAPEDAAVAALCATHGYGAVLDAAARLWARQDPRGALTVGPCRALVAAALALWEEEERCTAHD